VLFQLQRDVTREEDRDNLVKMVVELRAMTDVKWNALISLPSHDIIKYIREAIQNQFRDLKKVNKRNRKAREFLTEETPKADVETSKDEETKVEQLERSAFESEKSSETQSEPIDNTLDIADVVTMRANSSPEPELNELT